MNGSSPMIKNLLGSDEEETKILRDEPNVISLLHHGEDEAGTRTSEGSPMGSEESLRTSGLAYSAGIALFASVAFMLIIGWGADLLFGSSPWGIVVGILIGALIGFIQFFRITGQIFKK